MVTSQTELVTFSPPNLLFSCSVEAQPFTRFSNWKLKIHSWVFFLLHLPPPAISLLPLSILPPKWNFLSGQLYVYRFHYILSLSCLDLCYSFVTSLCIEWADSTPFSTLSLFLKNANLTRSLRISRGCLASRMLPCGRCSFAPPAALSHSPPRSLQCSPTGFFVPQAHSAQGFAPSIAFPLS